MTTIRLVPEHSAAQSSGFAVRNFIAPGHLRLMAPPPLALYIHFPWCESKCPYCDFNSHATHGAPIPEDAYLNALHADLVASLPSVWGRRITSIFIGGGTPSLISTEGLERLLSDIRALLPVEADAEITIEANPGAVDIEKFATFRALGINRLSLGVQSFDDEKLKSLGRIHNSEQARQAITAAKKHFDNINLDMMFALPQQTLEDCKRDVETALSFETTHLSFYHLTLEMNTLFACEPPEGLPDDDLAFEMQDLIQETLGQAGLDHYEVSAYARFGFRGRHNLNYWNFGDYIGIGAGAHGKLSFPEHIVRYARYRHPQRYIEQSFAGNAIEKTWEVNPKDVPFEFMLNALRIRDGVKTTLFTERCGLPLSAISNTLEKAVHKGLIDADPTRLLTTELGKRFLNDLQQMFLPD